MDHGSHLPLVLRILATSYLLQLLAIQHQVSAALYRSRWSSNAIFQKVQEDDLKLSPIRKYLSVSLFACTLKCMLHPRCNFLGFKMDKKENFNCLLLRSSYSTWQPLPGNWEYFDGGDISTHPACHFKHCPEGFSCRVMIGKEKRPECYESTLDALLDKWCQKNFATNPLFANHSIKALYGESTPRGGKFAWRCYATSTLSSNGLYYEGGVLYTTRHQEMQDIAVNYVNVTEYQVVQRGISCDEHCALRDQLCAPLFMTKNTHWLFHRLGFPCYLHYGSSDTYRYTDQPLLDDSSFNLCFGTWNPKFQFQCSQRTKSQLRRLCRCV